MTAEQQNFLRFNIDTIEHRPLTLNIKPHLDPDTMIQLLVFVRVNFDTEHTRKLKLLQQLSDNVISPQSHVGRVFPVMLTIYEENSQQ